MFDLSREGQRCALEVLRQRHLHLGARLRGCVVDKLTEMRVPGDRSKGKGDPAWGNKLLKSGICVCRYQCPAIVRKGARAARRKARAEAADAAASAGRELTEKQLAAKQEADRRMEQALLDASALESVALTPRAKGYVETLQREGHLTAGAVEFAKSENDNESKNGGNSTAEAADVFGEDEAEGIARRPATAAVGIVKIAHSTLPFLLPLHYKLDLARATDRGLVRKLLAGGPQAAAYRQKLNVNNGRASRSQQLRLRRMRARVQQQHEQAGDNAGSDNDEDDTGGQKSMPADALPDCDLHLWDICDVRFGGKPVKSRQIVAWAMDGVSSEELLEPLVPQIESAETGAAGKNDQKEGATAAVAAAAAGTTKSGAVVSPAMMATLFSGGGISKSLGAVVDAAAAGSGVHLPPTESAVRERRKNTSCTLKLSLPGRVGDHCTARRLHVLTMFVELHHLDYDASQHTTRHLGTEAARSQSLHIWRTLHARQCFRPGERWWGPTPRNLKVVAALGTHPGCDGDDIFSHHRLPPRERHLQVSPVCVAIVHIVLVWWPACLDLSLNRGLPFNLLNIHTQFLYTVTAGVARKLKGTSGGAASDSDSDEEGTAAGSASAAIGGNSKKRRSSKANRGITIDAATAAAAIAAKPPKPGVFLPCLRKERITLDLSAYVPWMLADHLLQRTASDRTEQEWIVAARIDKDRPDHAVSAWEKHEDGVGRGQEELDADNKDAGEILPPILVSDMFGMGSGQRHLPMQGFLTLEYVSLQTVPRIADADFALLLSALRAHDRDLDRLALVQGTRVKGLHAEHVAAIAREFAHTQPCVEALRSLLSGMPEDAETGVGNALEPHEMGCRIGCRHTAGMVRRLLQLDRRRLQGLARYLGLYASEWRHVEVGQGSGIVSTGKDRRGSLMWAPRHYLMREKERGRRMWRPLKVRAEGLGLHY